MKRILGAVMALLCIAPAVYAQIDRATLAGTVRDSAGGVLAGATVTVTNVATNVADKATTSSSGTYLVVNLRSGQYIVEAEAPGLQKAVQSVILEIGQRGRVDITLNVGSLTESVTVEGAVRLLNTEDATLGTVIENNSVANLPLAIRNWDDLLALVPGVQGDRYTRAGRRHVVRPHRRSQRPRRSLACRTTSSSTASTTTSISSNVQELTSQVSRPSVDAIQEFKIVTSPYSAEYGRSPGAAVSVSTKSGTNQLHGHGLRLLPQRVDGHRRLLLEAGRPAQVPPTTRTSSAPTLAVRSSRTRPSSSSTTKGRASPAASPASPWCPPPTSGAGILPGVRDPLTGQPFPGGVIPANRIDPCARHIMALVPLPNQPGANNFFRQADLIDNSDRILGRLDYKISSKRQRLRPLHLLQSRRADSRRLRRASIDGTGNLRLRRPEDQDPRHGPRVDPHPLARAW